MCVFAVFFFFFSLGVGDGGGRGGGGGGEGKGGGIVGGVVMFYVISSFPVLLERCVS